LIVYMALWTTRLAILGVWGSFECIYGSYEYKCGIMSTHVANLIVWAHWTVYRALMSTYRSLLIDTCTVSA